MPFKDVVHKGLAGLRESGEESGVDEKTSDTAHPANRRGPL